jgi:DNA modification methylase
MNLDTIVGSGTTAKMALLAGRQFIGSEISAEYCQLAETRIAKTRRQIKCARTIRRLNNSAS